MTREIVLNIAISELALSQNDIDPRSHARSSAWLITSGKFRVQALACFFKIQDRKLKLEL